MEGEEAVVVEGHQVNMMARQQAGPHFRDQARTSETTHNKFY